jgi:activating signal cointegrator 1
MWLLDNPLGSIVAIADLTDCLQMTNSETPAKGQICIHHQSHLELALGDWSPGRYAWKLENILALPEPIAHRGGQGLRFPPEGVCQQIEKMLEIAN